MDEEPIIADWKRRRRKGNALRVAGAVIAITGLLMLSSALDSPDSAPHWRAAVVLIIGVSVYGFGENQLRCPACNRSLALQKWRSFSPLKFCPSCGKRLEH